MRGRQLAALAASAALLLLFLLANNPRELARRVRFLTRSASQPASARRLGGSGAAFDRSFFFFVESARRQLPRGVRGVAIFMPRPTTESLHLAAYQLAPLPVLLDPGGVPPRWIAAFYRLPPPAGWRILAPLPDGALVSPP